MKEVLNSRSCLCQFFTCTQTYFKLYFYVFYYILLKHRFINLGLEFAKATIKEIVIWPMLRPDIFTGLRGPPKVGV